MDTYQREAMWRLGKSLASSGEIIETVSRWPHKIQHAKDQHIQGAIANAQKTMRAMAALVAV